MCSDDNVEDVHIMDLVALKTKVLASKIRKQLHWFCVVSASRKRLVVELLACNSINIVVVQESWEK